MARRMVVDRLFLKFLDQLSYMSALAAITEPPMNNDWRFFLDSMRRYLVGPWPMFGTHSFMQNEKSSPFL